MIMGLFRASAIALALVSLCCLSSALDVSHDGRALSLNGERKLIFSGSIHYPRSTPDMWPDLIQKAKEGGLNTIETYAFWNAHEPQRRQYNFEGNLDIVRFLKEVKNAGLYAILRIGPYVCAEWNYGGLPIWLHNVPGMEMRTNNPDFKEEMQNFTTLIVNMVKDEKLLAPQGGPIILTQIENEYHDAQSDYGQAGISYMNWCASMAESLNVDVPWIMCKQPDAPQPIIDTCNGFYCDQFKPNNPNSPKIWTENWAGWFQAWGLPVPYRPAEDLAFAVARFFQLGGSVHNYYMYHGGTNFGRTSGGPYITTSYDYDAPLDEYGNTRQPKWGHLKELHAVIKSMEQILLNGVFNSTDLRNNAWATKYSADGYGSGCFLSNTNSSYDATVTFEGNQYFLPAWSVSILPDCKQEVYNTAKINAQTSIMVKKPNQAEDEPSQLSWSWAREDIRVMRKASFSANGLLEQKMVTADSSDYLWYMTSVDMPEKDQMTLRVNTTGHGIYAFVNGRLVGSQYAPYADNRNYTFVYEQPITVRPGKNFITLLSVTVGLQNYKPHFDLTPVGILGPVQLIGSGNLTKDLSLNKWSYKVGLIGEEKELYLENSDHGHKWHSHSEILPINRPFTWYKTTFQPPLGKDPVVLDLQGMGKGSAWVNGHNIGRFWTNYTAPLDGCSHCDYRGSFNPSNCASGCGDPSQRWYHVPRSFFNASDPNTLVLFEEAGGNPSLVNFQTVTVGTTCASVPEGKTLNLSCQGSGSISEIQFASFGDSQGRCGSFEEGSCSSEEARSVVEKACVGQMSCSIDVSEDNLGLSNCGADIVSRLTVQAVC